MNGLSTDELRRRVAGPEGTVVRLRLREGSTPATAAIGPAAGAGGAVGAEFDVELVRMRRGFFPRVRGRACAAL